MGPSDAAIFTMPLKKHTGMLVASRTVTYTVQGTLAQCEAAYKKAQMHNLLAGWWGVISLLLYNWLTLLANARAIGAVRKMSAETQGARASA